MSNIAQHSGRVGSMIVATAKTMGIRRMMNRMLGCIHCIARPDLYSLEQWAVLILSVICLGVDIFAIYFTAEGSTLAIGHLSLNMLSHEALMWVAESVLFVAVLVLLTFAFSKRAERPEIV